MINRIRISLLLAIALYCLPGPLLLARSCSDAEVDSLQSLLTLSDISSAQRSDALFQLAYCMLKKDLDSALVYADEGLRLSEQVNYVSGTAKYYFILGKVKEISRSYEEAKQNYLRSIKLFDQVEKSEMYLRTCNSIAFIYEIQTDYDKALEYYMLGLEFARELKDILFIASFYNNISNIFF